MYYLLIDGAATGPFSPEEVQAKLAEGSITPQTLCAQVGAAEWIPLEAMPGVVAQSPATPRIISGFWRRVGAYCIDCLVLALPALMVGAFIFNFLVGLGAWALPIGLTIALAYFGLLNSAWGGGATLGKRWLGLEVVDCLGGHISVGRSIGRYLLFATPFYLNCLIQMVPVSMLSPLPNIAGTLVFAWGTAIFYLYVFNRRTRQSLHDLIVGTFVVRRVPPGPVQAPPVWRGHWIAVGVIAVLGVAGMVAGRSLLTTPFFARLLAVQQALLASGEVRGASVMSGTNWVGSSSGVQKSTNYTITAIWKAPPADVTAAENKVAAIALARDPGVMQSDFLIVTITSGYDLGIASWSNSVTVRHTPRRSGRRL